MLIKCNNCNNSTEAKTGFTKVFCSGCGDLIAEFSEPFKKTTATKKNEKAKKEKKPSFFDNLISNTETMMASIINSTTRLFDDDLDLDDDICFCDEDDTECECHDNLIFTNSKGKNSIKQQAQATNDVPTANCNTCPTCTSKMEVDNLKNKLCNYCGHKIIESTMSYNKKANKLAHKQIKKANKAKCKSIK